MARPLRPLINSGGYYPSRRWIPLVRGNGYTTQNGGEDPGIWKTVTGALIHITDALASPMQKCEVTLEPIQAGSGDPSPDNVRPITGWTGCEVNVTGVNICDLADAGIGTKSLYNLSSGTISIGGSGATLSGTNPIEITNTTNWRGVAFFSKPMKSGQQCKIRYRITGTSVSNIKRTFYIVDKTNAIVSKVSYASSVDQDADHVYSQSVTAVSNGDKAVLAVESATRQTITIYDLSFNCPSTDTDYHAYQGTTLSVTFPDSAGTVYGGTVDLVTGDGEITQVKWIENGSRQPSIAVWAEGTDYNCTLFDRFTSSSGLRQKDFVGNENKFICNNRRFVDIAGTEKTYANTFASYRAPGSYSFCYSIPKTLTTKAEISAWFAENPSEVVYLLQTPIPFHIDPTVISTFQDENNIWADCGDIEITYKAQAE